MIDADEPVIDPDEPMIDVDEGNEQNEEARRRKSFVWKHFTYKKPYNESSMNDDLN